MTTSEPKSVPLPDSSERAAPDLGPDGLPRPFDAMMVGFDQRFVRAVAVALMRVMQDGPPNVGPSAAQMCRHIVENPEEQARRFAVALASDPEVVMAALATNDNPGEISGGLVVLTDRVRAIWAIMAGDTSMLGGSVPPDPSAGFTHVGKGGG